MVDLFRYGSIIMLPGLYSKLLHFAGGILNCVIKIQSEHCFT